MEGCRIRSAIDDLIAAVREEGSARELVGARSPQLLAALCGLAQTPAAEDGPSSPASTLAQVELVESSAASEAPTVQGVELVESSAASGPAPFDSVPDDDAATFMPVTPVSESPSEATSARCCTRSTAAKTAGTGRARSASWSRSARRSPMPTPRGSSIAISSRPTSWSAASARPT